MGLETDWGSKNLMWLKPSSSENRMGLKIEWGSKSSGTENRVGIKTEWESKPSGNRNRVWAQNQVGLAGKKTARMRKNRSVYYYKQEVLRSCAQT